ncbi:MAG: signal peptidase II [Candidatus Kerfeldbacteria bacterium]|nr:signal peptidase II [Candidatus Kerfeldbacteria bacterium]
MANRCVIWMIGTTVAAFVTDRILKQLAISGSTLGPPDGGVRFELLPNPAIAFSLALPSTLTMWLIPPVLVVFVWLGVRLVRRGEHVRAAAAGMVVVGSLSNYLDRLQHGFVVDYVSFGTWFPVFNLSDWLIVAGLIVLIVRLDGRRTTR